MTRFLGMLGLGGGFLLISPNLRASLSGGLEKGFDTLVQNSPYSWIGVGIVVIGGGMLFLYKASQPR